MVHSGQRTGNPEEKQWEQEKLNLMLKSLMAYTTAAFKYIKVAVAEKGGKLHWKCRRERDPQLKHKLVVLELHGRFRQQAQWGVHQIGSGGSETFGQFWCLLKKNLLRIGKWSWVLEQGDGQDIYLSAFSDVFFYSCKTLCASNYTPTSKWIYKDSQCSPLQT